MAWWIREMKSASKYLEWNIHKTVGKEAGEVWRGMEKPNYDRPCECQIRFEVYPESCWTYFKNLNGVLTVVWIEHSFKKLGYEKEETVTRGREKFCFLTWKIWACFYAEGDNYISAFSLQQNYGGEFSGQSQRAYLLL